MAELTFDKLARHDNDAPLTVRIDKKHIVQMFTKIKNALGGSATNQQVIEALIAQQYKELKKEGKVV